MDKPVGVGKALLRVARPTNDLPAVINFYRDGLGLTVLSEFKNHAGFDGVMLGHKVGRTISSSRTKPGTKQAGPD
jgi:hypothetical protein